MTSDKREVSMTSDKREVSINLYNPFIFFVYEIKIHPS